MRRRTRHTREELRESMRHAANMNRSTADEMATMFGGCDDPLHPTMRFDPQSFRDWHDFHHRVIVPLVEHEDDEASIQAAMRLYRQANPHFIAVCLYMAARSEPIGSTIIRIPPAD